MLTVEMLQQNTQLSGLTVEQFKAIAEMSQNDENTVIGTKIGALHGQYDNDILSITGVAKNAGEKSYDYLKRVLNSYKADHDSLKETRTKLTNAEAKVTKLEKQIADGTQDESIKQQLKDARTQVTQLQNQLSAKQKEFDDKKHELETQLQTTHVDYAFASAIAGMKFKANIPEGIQKTLLSAAKDEVLRRGTPEFQQMADGSQRLVFRGADGNVLNNPSNNLNPYTFQELIMETSIKDVIDTGKQQPGTGTKPSGQQQPGGSSAIDLSGVKTQVEADRAIEAYLLNNGLTRDSEEFATQLITLRSENNVSELPIR